MNARAACDLACKGCEPGLVRLTLTLAQVATNPVGLVVALLAVACTAVYQIWAGAKQKELGAGSMQLMHQFAPHATGLLAGLVVGVEPLGLPGSPGGGCALSADPITPHAVYPWTTLVCHQPAGRPVRWHESLELQGLLGGRCSRHQHPGKDVTTCYCQRPCRPAWSWMWKYPSCAVPQAGWCAAIPNPISLALSPSSTSLSIVFCPGRMARLCSGPGCCTGLICTHARTGT